MAKTSPSPRSSRRSDAERNRARILDAARTAFADPEGDVSMAEISRRAGVGSATLYRNFASRRELLEALYVDEIDEVCAAAGNAAGTDAFEALVRWLRRFYDYFTGKRLLADELLVLTDAEAPVFETGYARVRDAGLPLLEAARRAGEVRDDLTIEQILGLVGAIGKIPGPPEHRLPILEAAFDALRPAAQNRSGKNR